MAKERKRYSADFKPKAVLAVLKGDRTAAQLAGELGVHPMALSEWKHQFLASAHEVFDRWKRKGKNPEKDTSLIGKE